MQTSSKWIFWCLVKSRRSRNKWFGFAWCYAPWTSKPCKTNRKPFTRTHSQTSAQRRMTDWTNLRYNILKFIENQSTILLHCCLPSLWGMYHSVCSWRLPLQHGLPLILWSAHSPNAPRSCWPKSAKYKTSAQINASMFFDPCFKLPGILW